MWFVIPRTSKGKLVFENVQDAMLALDQEEDNVNITGEVNVDDQVELWA